MARAERLLSFEVRLLVGDSRLEIPVLSSQLLPHPVMLSRSD